MRWREDGNVLGSKASREKKIMVNRRRGEVKI